MPSRMVPCFTDMTYKLLRVTESSADLCGKAGPTEVGQAAVQSLRQHPRQDLVHSLQRVHRDALRAGHHYLRAHSNTINGLTALCTMSLLSSVAPLTQACPMVPVPCLTAGR